jgi:exodeoxyribonuclease VII small subunit
MKQSMTYEEAFKRLEEILNLMNSGQVPLDSAVNLYKEADELTRFCEKKLNEAENTIETLIRDRDNQFACQDNKPSTQEFNPSKTSL